MSFHLFSFVHAAILICIAALGLSSGLLLRRRPAIRRTSIRILGSILAMLELTWYGYVLTGDWPIWPASLPLHLCDIVVWLTVVAAIGGIQRPFELAYFWGFTGTTMALMTPDVQGMSFSYPVVQFFLSHGLVIVILLAITVSGERRPGAGSIGRAVAWLHVLAAVLFAFNAATGSNYMYLNSKPFGSSILDVMGPWPVYLFAADLLGLLLFWLLWLPFRRTSPDVLST